MTNSIVRGPAGVVRTFTPVALGQYVVTAYLDNGMGHLAAAPSNGGDTISAATGP